MVEKLLLKKLKISIFFKSIYNLINKKKYIIKKFKYKHKKFHYE